ncbi:hypothetical protein [Trichocoleus sp. FACHB-262]|uniref:hypothetical protein n=1 Tax=Trichocoleus sp. FACHB-262 TaxID=2692869 RepID=UPI001683B096|nr:hypothetical protein [Trichocoleus sp. FACHB-262]MBD2120084.1 hypothetical protein [Trichocoleus sp. FACHB-262]
MNQKIIFTCADLPPHLPLGYQFFEAPDFIECELLEGETSQEALARAKTAGLTVVGWSVKKSHPKV